MLQMTVDGVGWWMGGGEGGGVCVGVGVGG